MSERLQLPRHLGLLHIPGALLAPRAQQQQEREREVYDTALLVLFQTRRAELAPLTGKHWQELGDSTLQVLPECQLVGDLDAPDIDHTGTYWQHAHQQKQIAT